MNPQVPQHNSRSFVPEQNIATYAAVWLVEVCLRELVIERTAIKNPRDYKTCLPGGAILKKYRDARRKEQSHPWKQLVPHHPIYYLDYPELVQILSMNPNWTPSFADFTKRKDQLISALKDLEPVRNAVAHNRKLTTTDHQVAETLVSKLKSVLTEQYFHDLVSREANALDLVEHFHALAAGAKRAFDAMQAAAHVPADCAWGDIQNAWWFDSDYLEINVQPIEAFFNTVIEYSRLPRTRGDAYRMERWLSDHDIPAVYAECYATLTASCEEL